MQYRFIGDVHGKFMGYMNLCIDSPNPTIQIGDFGLGFSKPMDEWVQEWMRDNDGHEFIRGNHDNPTKCKNTAGYIPDGTVKDNMMFIGGAWSIDRAWRTEGLDWWNDEELSLSDLNRLINVYETVKPDIMVTHDCPILVSKEIFFDGGIIKHDERYETRTGQALQSMFEIHQPKLHIFGHWHHTVDKTINGTRFICLNELDWADVDTETMNVTFRDRWMNG